MKGYVWGASVLVVVIALMGLYFIYDPTEAPSTEVEESSVSVVYMAPANDAAPAGFHTYTNDMYGFSIEYPESLQAIDHAERAGAHSVTFESDTDEKGFQIFITPYNGNQITASRINLDTRGTAQGEPQEVVLDDGTRALIFFSESPVLGTLREVWFIHDGYLYEVTTYAEFDVWLTGIMKTWRFNT
jgi:hypothetical protein